MAPTPPTSGPATPRYRRPLEWAASGRRPCRSASAWSRPRDGSASRWLSTARTAALLGDSTVEALTAQLEAVIAGVCDAPERPLAEIDLVTPEERDRLLGTCNDTARPVPEACIHALFSEQARLTPDATALVFRGRRMSYRELDERTNRLGRHLRGLGVAPGTLVGILLHRSFAMVEAVLGTLKAGGRLRAPRPHLPGRAHRLHGPRRRPGARPDRGEPPLPGPGGHGTGRGSRHGARRDRARRRPSRSRAEPLPRTSPTSSTPRARPAGRRA